MLDVFYISLIVLSCPVSIQLYYLYKYAYRIRVSVDDTETMQSSEDIPIF
jgi:hypothetical protein